MIIKVKIKKVRNGNHTKFKYPEGYDTQTISPFIYENRGKNTEYCLAKTSDEFTPTKDMVQVTTEEADALIDKWVNENKDLKEDHDKVINIKKQHLCTQ